MNPLTKYILDLQPEPVQAHEHKPYVNLSNKNIEVGKAYTNIIQDMRWLLSRMTTKENRSYILTSYAVADKFTDNVLCEFVSIMCELRLCVNEYCYYIEMDTDSDITKVIGGYNYRKMLRSAYRNTSYENTRHDLEDCINIETNMQNHHSYFRNRLKEHDNPDTLIVIEDIIYY
jgi:hypothetical protein